MMDRSTDLAVLKGILIVFSVGLSFAFSYVLVSHPKGIVQNSYRRYLAYLESRLRHLFFRIQPKHFALAHAMGSVAMGIIGMAFSPLCSSIFFVLSLLLPPSYLEHLCKRKTELIDAQTDGFLVALANILKSTPSLGDAIKSVEELLLDPLRQELQLALKQLRLGSSLDQALLDMAARARSPQLESAMSALLIGRQVGGNLTAILEATAHSLREMSRLDGVVRSKTAEGRTQLLVLALFPFVLCSIFYALSPHYFDPFVSSFVGYLLLFLAILLWGSSLLLARKIVQVEL